MLSCPAAWNIGTIFHRVSWMTVPPFFIWSNCPPLVLPPQSAVESLLDFWHEGSNIIPVGFHIDFRARTSGKNLDKWPISSMSGEQNRISLFCWYGFILLLICWARMMHICIHIAPCFSQLCMTRIIYRLSGCFPVERLVSQNQCECSDNCLLVVMYRNFWRALVRSPNWQAQLI